MRWIKLFTSIVGSTLVEEGGPTGVGIWTLTLSMAGNDKTPGSFKFKNIPHLARIFNTETAILEKYLKVFQETGRIKIKVTGEESILRVLKWQEYQQDIRGGVDGHNKGKKAKDGRPQSAQEERRREERKGDEIKGEEIRQEEREESEERKPSNQEIFFSLLKSFPSYPFQESEDIQIYEMFNTKIDIIEQTKRKIAWWKQNPQALQSRNKSLRQQLVTFLTNEVDFQNGRK